MRTAPFRLPNSKGGFAESIKNYFMPFVKPQIQRRRKNNIPTQTLVAHTSHGAYTLHDLAGPEGIEPSFSVPETDVLSVER